MINIVLFGKPGAGKGTQAEFLKGKYNLVHLSTAQAEALDKFLTKKGWNVTATIALEAKDDVLVQRILERGKTSGRADDQDEAKIRTRYAEYNQKTAPLIDFYNNQNKYYPIDGIGTVASITSRVSEVIDTL